jgi:hypothetical protein
MGRLLAVRGLSNLVPIAVLFHLICSFGFPTLFQLSNASQMSPKHKKTTYNCYHTKVESSYDIIIPFPFKTIPILLWIVFPITVKICKTENKFREQLLLPSMNYHYREQSLLLTRDLEKKKVPIERNWGRSSAWFSSWSRRRLLDLRPAPPGRSAVHVRPWMSAWLRAGGQQRWAAVRRCCCCAALLCLRLLPPIALLNSQT